MNPQQKKQLFVLFLTLLVVMIGFGIILPIMPFYAQSLGATATHLGLLFATYSLMQFLFSPLWGRLSDRVGRKPILLVGLAGMAVSFVLFGFAQTLWMLFAARLLGGLLSSAVLPTAMAYVADSTGHRHRGKGMGLMGAAMGLGMIFGPAIGGFLGANPTVPFLVAAGLALLVVGFAAVFLPESLGREVRDRIRSQSQSQPPGSVHTRVLRELRGPLGPLLGLSFLSQAAFASMFGTFALFTEAKLGFGEAQMGAVFAVMGLVGALGQGILAGRAIAAWGEERVTQIGLLVSGVGFWSLLLSYDLVSLLVLASGMGLGGALITPAISALLSKRTPPERQGAILGVFHSFQSLGRIAGPLGGGLVFDLLGYAFPYVLAGGLFLFLGLTANLFTRSQGTGARSAPSPSSSPASCASLDRSYPPDRS